MLIYEKDNKLNINFENNVEETPDLQICKSGDKTEVLIDGQQGSSSSSIEPVTITVDLANNTWSGATWEELKNAFIYSNTFANSNSIVKKLIMRGLMKLARLNLLDLLTLI